MRSHVAAGDERDDALPRLDAHLSRQKRGRRGGCAEFARHLHASVEPPKRLAKLIADLDNDDFALREQATKDLRNLGRFILPALRKALEGKPGIEGKRRLEELTEDAAKASPPPEMLRVARALETLELMGGPESRQAIEALAKDARIKWLQEAASDSLRRQRPEKP